MAATTTLSLALVLHDAARDPYQSTREATAGPDVVASAADPVPGGPADAAALEALTDAPGVVAHSGPFPVTSVVLEAHGETGTALLEGRDVAPAAVDQPQLTEGSWIGDGDGGVVVEAAFADAFGIGA